MRYSGKLGVAKQVESPPGVWEEEITEHVFIGTVTQKSETVEVTDSVLPQYRTTTTVSGFVRGLGQMDNSMLRYLTYAGKRWTITSETSKFPRLTLYFGEEYHGPLPDGVTATS